MSDEQSQTDSVNPPPDKYRWQKAWQRKRKASGMCLSCKDRAEEGKTRCRACLDKINAKMKDRYKRLHAGARHFEEKLTGEEAVNQECGGLTITKTEDAAVCPHSCFPRQEDAQVVAEVIPTTPAEPPQEPTP